MSRRKLFIDSFWTMGSHILALVVVLVANVVFARLMSPSEFGQLAIVMFFISVFNVFTDGGLSGALVRKLDRKEEDYATVFTFNLIVSVILFFTIILLSKPISVFYSNPSLQNPIIVASSILLISTFQTVQNVQIVQDLEFKKKGIITLISTISGVVIGGILAIFFKLGIWALISIPISTSFFQVILFIYYKGFFFNIHFNKNSFNELFGFGVNTTLVSVLNITFDNIYQLIIGKIFSINTLGYFYQAKKMQDVPNNVINNLSQSVFYSTLSKNQDKRDELVKTYQLISSTFISLMGFAVLIVLFFGEDIIHFLFGEKWIQSAYYIKLLIIGSLFYSQELINRIIFKIFNKTSVLLKLEILKKTVQAVTLLVGIYSRSIDILLYGYIGTSAFSYFLSYFYTNEIIDMGKKEIKILIQICILILILYLINFYSYQLVFNNWFLSVALLFVYLVSLALLKIVNLKILRRLNTFKI